MPFKVKFWGVRGSIACPGPRHVVFGGNTSCVEVSMGGKRVILDAGTGIREMGHWFLRRGMSEATILLSHTHWDHINGFPFFAPAFHSDCTFNIMAGHLTGNTTIQMVLADQMAHPFFPVPIEIMNSKMVYEDFNAGDSWNLTDDIKVKTTPLRHPDNATGYRLEYKGKSMCYITDTEHVPGSPDENILALIEGADMVIYDSTYNDDEFPSKIGWGHSTWEEGVRLCKAANVKRLAIFHHDPDHEDQIMEEIEETARNTWEGAFVARENMVVHLQS